jgi:hypothetical protein
MAESLLVFNEVPVQEMDIFEHSSWLLTVSKPMYSELRKYRLFAALSVDFSDIFCIRFSVLCFLSLSRVTVLFPVLLSCPLSYLL